MPIPFSTTSGTLPNRFLMFTNPNVSNDVIKEVFQISDTSEWELGEARKKAAADDIPNIIQPYLYRPFDYRWVYYTDNIISRTCKRIMSHLLMGNKALITTRIIPPTEYVPAFVSDLIGDIHSVSGQSYFFPLYLYLFPSQKDLSKGTPEAESRQTNFKPEFVTAIQNMFGKEPSPEEIFYYIYGVLYSNIYRQKYEEFLQIDFPKIPFTSDYRLFQETSQLGKQLVELHLLKSSLLSQPEAKYPIVGTDKVEKREYQEKTGRVFINSQQSFEGIPKEAWEYCIGSYQVLDKWLKDRKGRSLSPDDVEHYLKVITAIKHTINLQHKIDEIYPGVEESLMPLSM
jgi:predicted helicase